MLDYAKHLLRQYKLKDKNIYIRALGSLGYITMKSLDKQLNHIENDYDDYLNGRVRNTDRFTEFNKIEYVLFT